MKPILEFWHYKVYLKGDETFDYDKALSCWIFYNTATIGEINFTLSKDGECYIHSIILFASNRYMGHGKRFIWMLMSELMTNWFRGDNTAVRIRGVATPIEGEIFWKHLHAKFLTPIYGSKRIETEEGVMREVVGIPFVISEKLFEELDIDVVRLFRKGEVIYRGSAIHEQ